MPTSAVYQPTTVTYEQQPADQRFNCPMNYFPRRLTSTLNRGVCLRVGFTLFGAALMILGLAMLVTGGIIYSGPDPEISTDEDPGVNVLISGGVFLCVGLMVAGVSFYAWQTYGSGKDSPTGNAAALSGLNPSTDPLFAAQYAPVRDTPPAPDHDEMRTLMDNKECLSSAEESDKMLDGRPSVA